MGLSDLAGLLGGGLSASSSATSGVTVGDPFVNNGELVVGGSGSSVGNNSGGTATPTTSQTTTSSASVTPQSQGVGAVSSPAPVAASVLNNGTLTYLLLIGAAVAAFIAIQTIAKK